MTGENRVMCLYCKRKVFPIIIYSSRGNLGGKCPFCGKLVHVSTVKQPSLFSFKQTEHIALQEEKLKSERNRKRPRLM